MGIFRRENLFCTLCKKSISFRQKPKRKWNLEGYLCGDCYLNEMEKQYKIKEEIKRKSNVKPQPPDRLAEKFEKFAKSTKSIKIGYYLTILSIVASSLMTIHGLMAGDTIRVTIGVIFLIIGLIQFPKRKKEFEGISKINDEPLTTLKMRLAKGEITKEEFDKIKEDLK